MSIDNPKVSVIVPTYNRSEYIGEAIKSVFEQTEKNWELLIVDDGSTDDTHSALLPFLSDSRVHYQYQENQGQSVARNKALQSAKGDFICFLDSDNSWLPRKLEIQLANMNDRKNVDIMYGDIITMDENGNEVSRKNMRRFSGKITPKLLSNNFISMNTTMTRRHCFDEMGGMAVKHRVSEDYDLWLRFSAKYHFFYINEYFARYRVMENRLSSDKIKHFDTNEIIILDFLANYSYTVTSEQAESALCTFYSRKARNFAAEGDRSTALKAIFQAFSRAPFHKVVWRAMFRVFFPSKIN